MEASGSSGDGSRRTWISSQELYRLRSNCYSPTSPDASSVSLAPCSPLTEDVNWFKKVPCCHLKSLEDGGKGQGIIICLGVNGSHQHLSELLGVSSSYPALALLTNHHIIPSKSNAKKWKLSVHGMEMKKLNVTLDEKRIDSCKSCCGRDGVLSSKEHPRAVCPFRADFTILVLSREFSSELLKNRELKFPILAPLGLESLKSALQSERFYIFKRDEETGVVRDVEVTLCKVQPPTSDDLHSLDAQIMAYKQMCLLRYDINTSVYRGDSGAGIFYKRGNERLLLGLHKSTEEDEGYHSGIAVHAIFHAITGGEVRRLIPALSLLKDGKMCKQLRKSFYENVRVCFEAKQGAAVQVSDDDRSELTLERVIHILEYILKEELLVLKPGEELTSSSLDLLATILNYFFQFDHGTIKGCVRAIYPDEKTRGSFYEDVCKAGEQVCRLCQEDEKIEIVESSFVCWQRLSYFPLHRAVFTDATKFAKMTRVRNSERFQDNLIVQKAFGGICLAYQLHIRNESQKEKDQFHVEMKQQRVNFEREREQCEKRVKEALQEEEKRRAALVAEIEEERKRNEEEIGALKERFCAEQEQLRRANQLLVEKSLVLEQCEQDISALNAENEELAQSLNQQQTPERSHLPPLRNQSELIMHTRLARSQYPTRHVFEEDDRFENFWKRDIADVLNTDVALREKIAKYFEKNTGSEGGGTWEHLISHLTDKHNPNFRMNAKMLERLTVAEILLSIVLEWSKIEKVTIKEFCEVSKNLGIGRVEDVLQKAESTAYDTPEVRLTTSLPSCHDSDEAVI